MLFLTERERKVWHVDDTKREISSNFILDFLDLQLDHTMPAATLHFQNIVLSENYTPGQMIADTTPVWWKNAMNNWSNGLRLKKG